MISRPDPGPAIDRFAEGEIGDADRERQLENSNVMASDASVAA